MFAFFANSTSLAEYFDQSRLTVPICWAIDLAILNLANSFILITLLTLKIIIQLSGTKHHLLYLWILSVTNLERAQREWMVFYLLLDARYWKVWRLEAGIIWRLICLQLMIAVRTFNRSCWLEHIYMASSGDEAGLFHNVVAAKRIARQKPCPLYDLAQEMTQHHFCHILLVREVKSTPRFMGRENKLHCLMAK